MLTEHLPPGLPPRGLTKIQAAAYTGCATERAFEEHVRKGTFPGPMRGMSRYDRLALDDAMDRLSGRAKPAAEDDADAILAEWRSRQ